MTCEAVEATIPDYLDETLEPWLRTAVQEHLGECVRCAGLMRDLRNLQRDAAALPDLVPERDLWKDIARGIGTPVVPLAPIAALQPAPVAASQAATASPGQPVAAAASQAAPVAPRYTRVPYDVRPYDRRFGPLGMSLAAAALVVVTASTTYLLTVRSLRPVAANVASAPSVAKPAPTAPSIADAGITDAGIAAAPPQLTPMQPDSLGITSPAVRPPSLPGSQVATASLVSRPSPADPVYENEVEKLQTIMTWRKGQLNPATAAIIDHNLRIIDAAIAQSKEALRNDPGSPMLSDQLTHALDKKVELLRRAAMLRPST